MQWTPQQTARVAEMRAAGASYDSIATEFGCTAASVRGAAHRSRPTAANVSVIPNGSRPLESMGRIGKSIATIGSAKPGRYRVAHFTDIHHGSKFCDGKAFLDLAQWAVDEGATAVVCTGDILDGQKACLSHEQRCIGADDQALEAVEIWSASAFRKHSIPVVAIGGNHDGYAHSATGIDYGAVLRDRMREAGLSWQYLGQCLGRARVHGAKWELWHPMGAGSTRNAVRRILNARAEAYEVADRPDVLAIGHYHRHTSFTAYPERIFCVSGGTFQRKGSEFANRITGGWDVGAGIVSYTIRDDGSVAEFAAEFRAVENIAVGWAA
jgi:predicted MPP superfamily phosphohydrolase